MQSAIMIEQVYSRHNYTNYPDAYYDMCNGKVKSAKHKRQVEKVVYCGISYGHTYRMGEGKFIGYRNRIRRSPVQSKSIQIEAFL